MDENQIDINEQQTIPADAAVPEQVEEDVNQEDVNQEEAVQKQHPTEKRIKKLSAKLAEKDAEIEYLKQLAFSDKQSRPHVSQEVIRDISQKPNLDDYESVADFTEALTEWKLERKLAENVQKTAQQNVIHSFNSRVETFVKSEAPDYREAVTEVLPFVTTDVESFCLESEVGPQIMYALANNESELDRFAKMTNARKLAYIANLETKLMNDKTVHKTNAPAPVKKVTANPVTTASTKEQSYQEWLAERNASLKKR